MKSKIYTAKSGAWVTFERTQSNCAPYIVRLYNSAGDTLDKVRADSYGAACEYWAAFKVIARGAA